MEPRATIFIEVMLVFAVIGVLAFLIGLIIRVPRRLPAGAAAQPEQTPRWYEFVLALILLAAIAAFAIWLISSTTQWVWGETIEDWRSDTRTIVFASIMVGLAVLGLVASLIYALLHAAPTARETAARSRPGPATSSMRRESQPSIAPVTCLPRLRTAASRAASASEPLPAP